MQLDESRRQDLPESSGDHTNGNGPSLRAQPDPSIHSTEIESHPRQLLTSLEYSRYPLLCFLVCLLAGIGLSGLLNQQAAVWLLALTIVLLGSTLLLLQWENWTGRTICTALSCMVSFGAFFGLVSRPPLADTLSPSAERKAKPIAVRAEIISPPIWRPSPQFRSTNISKEAWRTQLEIECIEVRDDQRWVPAEARSVLFVEGRVDDLLPGDRIQFYGTYRSTQSATNPGAFDLASRSRQHRRFTSMSVPARSQITLLSRDLMSRPLSRLRALAINRIDSNLRHFVGEQHASLAAALTFGQREQVDWQDQQELMATGTLHLLAISGLHVEILAVFVISTCLFFGASRKAEFGWTASVCLLYAGLAGGKPPVLRAAIVVLVIAFARLIGKRTRLTNSLSFAAIILILLHAANVANVGVHLSFLAVCSIGVFAIGNQRISPAQRVLLGSVRIEKETDDVQQLVSQSNGLLSKLRRFMLIYFKQGFTFSFWVWLMTCPLVWFNFHIVAPIAIPLNLLLGIPLVISLLSALIAGILGFIWPLGVTAGTTCHYSLDLISILVDLGKAIPAGHFWLPAPPWWWLATFYGFTVCWVALKRKHHQLAYFLLAWLVVGLALFSSGPRGKLDHLVELPDWQSTAIKQTSELRCTFLDVGHGTCVVLEFPNGEVWLYDAGHMGNAERSHESIANALWTLPTSRIQRLIISHADIDHYNAVTGLAERFAIGNLTSTERFWNSQDSFVQRIVKLSNTIASDTWTAGSKGQVGQVEYEVLHPRASELGESDNANSICLQVSYAGQYILLPGDLEGPGLVDLTQLPNRPCQVLMAPHHGSLAIQPESLLEWCRPELVVVSGNYRAARQEVIQNYGSSGQQVAVTFRDGAVQVRIAPTGERTVWHWENDSWRELK